MTIRKLSAFVPSALVVGLGAHLAAAGFDHAPGGRWATVLLGSLLLWSAATLAAAFLAGLFGTRYPSIATRASNRYHLARLALAGAAVYIVVEAVEGHLEPGALLRACLACVPLAFLVAASVRKAIAVAARAGVALAARFQRPSRGGEFARPADRERRRLAHDRAACDSRRGRAPPLFA